MELTPRPLPFPHVFYLIRERYKVVPHNYHHCRMHKILRRTGLSRGVLSADYHPYLGSLAFDNRVDQHLDCEETADCTYKSLPAVMSSCKSV